MTLRPDLEGRALRHPGTEPIYIIIDGILRWIPDVGCFIKLFGNYPHNWDDIWMGPPNFGEMDLKDIDGFNPNYPGSNFSNPLPYQVTCIRGSVKGDVYLIDYKDGVFHDETADPYAYEKRYFDGWPRFDKYNFDRSTIDTIHQLAVNAIPISPYTMGERLPPA